MSASRKIIINADDYGMCSATVDGIIACAQSEVITSTTFMATMPGFDYGLKRIRDLGRVGIGAHLDLTKGRPLSKPEEAPSAVNSDGSFRNPQLPESLAKINPLDLKTEFKKQIMRLLDNEIKISHIDNHKPWIYFSPAHFRVVVELASEFKVPMRYPFFNLSEPRLKALSAATKIPAEAILACIKICLKEMSARDVQTTDYFGFEYTLIPPSPDALRGAISSCPAGSSEICVHPGYANDRQNLETKILLQLKDEDVFRSQDFDLICFNKLRGGA